MNTMAYAGYSKNENIRQNSSSGGIFYELAKYIISKNGVVCGAKFDENWNVVHDCTDTLNGVKIFMKSKYVQSDTSKVFCQIKKYLESDRYVLFSGTPCQVAGLKSFLIKNYTKLVTIDFVCHGVPSRKVWRKYLELRSKGNNIANIDFRNKANGWNNYSLKIDFLNGNTYQENPQNDLYMRGFLQDIYLRPSCYNCKFKGVQRNSDITLADLWGCQKILPEMFDNKGTSLILVHSKQGSLIWNAIASEIQSCDLLTDEYLEFNPSIWVSANQNKKRKRYFCKSTWANLEKLTKASTLTRALSVLRKYKKG